MGGESLGKWFECAKCGDPILARDEILALYLVPVARSFVKAKVRKSLSPRTGYAALDGRVVAAVVRRRHHLVCRRRCTVTGRARLAVALTHVGLEPDLVDEAVPAGEETHAVRAVHDRVEPREIGPGHVDEDVLAHPVRRLDGKGHRGRHTKGTQRNDSAKKTRVSFIERDAATPPHHELNSADGGGQVLIASTRAVGAGGAGARDRYMGEGSKV